MAEIHHLHFLENEDEAQMTGYNFEVLEDSVIVRTTFHYPEYEQTNKDNVMTKPAARKLWLELVQSGEFEETK